MYPYLLMLFLLFPFLGCATMGEPFPPGERVEVTEWTLLQGAGGTQTLRGTVSNNSRYLVYDLDLIAQMFDGETLKEELKIRLQPLFPGTQTPFEFLLTPEFKGAYPVFQYHYLYTREEEFWEYRYDRKFGIPPFYFYPNFQTSLYRAAEEHIRDTRVKK